MLPRQIKSSFAQINKAKWCSNAVGLTSVLGTAEPMIFEKLDHLGHLQIGRLSLSINFRVSH